MRILKSIIAWRPSPCRLSPLLVLGLLLAIRVNVRGQHVDIELWYDQGQIVVATDTAPGIQGAQFPTSGLFRQFTSNPGFISETDVGKGLGSGDIITYDVTGPLAFWDGSGFAELGVEVAIRIENNGGNDTMVTGASGLQGGDMLLARNLLGEASPSGNFHRHVDYFLEPNDDSSPVSYGAYGLNLRLGTTATDIAKSDPFWILFNYGLDDQAWSDAVSAFSALLNPSIEGDYNSNGVVDAADYTVWKDSFGATDLLAADGNENGIVDAADYTIWKDNFGRSQSGLAGVGVPEPALAIPVLLAYLVLGRRLGGRRLGGLRS
ncbi:MAG: hypothetical protein R3E01_07240 [Pirellulaceae bacterium]